MSINLRRCGPNISDCTAPYDVIIDGNYTVADFVSEINDGKEWGTWGSVYVNSEPYWYGGTRVCSYGRGRTEWYTHDFDRCAVVSAHVCGGWGAYDFYVVIRED